MELDVPLRNRGVVVLGMAAVALAGAGCFGPSSPGEEPADEEDLAVFAQPLGVDRICRDGTRSEVALDAATELGFSAEDVLAFAGGEHLQVRVPGFGEAGASADDAPTLRVALEAIGEAARHFVPEAGIVGHGLVCHPWLELDVRVSVETSDGALDTRFDATLFAMHPDVAILYARPDGVDLQLLLSPYGLSARLWDDDTLEFNDTAPAQRFAAPDCTRDADFSLPVDAAHHGVTALELVARMQTLTALDVVWDDGTQSAASLRLGEPAEHACLRVDAYVPGNTALSVEASLELVTGDGRFAATLPGPVGGSPARAPGQVGFMLDEARFARSAPPGLGFTQYAERTDLDLQAVASFTLDEADVVSGSLLLLERPADFCEPGADPAAMPCSGELLLLEQGNLVSP